MANSTISNLTAATTPLAGTEVLPIVQSGTTVKVANNDLRPKQIQSNATSGVLQVSGPSAGNTRVMTTPDSNFTAARTDAGQTFTGNQQITGTLNATNSGGIYTSTTTTARGSGSNYFTFADPSGTKGYVGYISGGSDNMYLWNSINAPVLIGVNGTNTWTFDTSQNFVPQVAGKGINFTANTPLAGMTSQNLNWYETGTWTPADGSGAGLSLTFNATSYYTKTGNMVTCNMDVTFPVTINASIARITLPFAPKVNCAGGSIAYTTRVGGMYLNLSSGGTFVFSDLSGNYLTNANMSTTRSQLSFSYIAA